MKPTRRRIRQYTQQIAEQFCPERIVLFGSHAYGKATDDSDVDLLVIMPFRGRSVNKAAEIQLQVRPPFPLDLLVRTPEKIRQRLAWGDCFIEEIIEKGVVLYEAGRS